MTNQLHIRTNFARRARRLIAAVLAFAMVLALLPAMTLKTSAAAVPTTHTVEVRLFNLRSPLIHNNIYFGMMDAQNEYYFEGTSYQIWYDNREPPTTLRGTGEDLPSGLNFKREGVLNTKNFSGDYSVYVYNNYSGAYEAAGSGSFSFTGGGTGVHDTFFPINWSIALSISPTKQPTAQSTYIKASNSTFTLSSDYQLLDQYGVDYTARSTLSGGSVSPSGRGVSLSTNRKNITISSDATPGTYTITRSFTPAAGAASGNIVHTVTLNRYDVTGLTGNGTSGSANTTTVTATLNTAIPAADISGVTLTAGGTTWNAAVSSANTANKTVTVSVGTIPDGVANGAAATIAMTHSDGCLIYVPSIVSVPIYKITGTAPTITTASFSDAQVGVPYTANLAATGTAPITWSAENLPAGLSISGSAISGTPSAAGTSNVTITATNAQGSAQRVIPLTVEAAALSSLEGTVSIALNATTGGLTANIDGLTNESGTISYAWSGTGVTDSSTNTLAAADYDLGRTVTLSVSDSDHSGSKTATITVYRVGLSTSGSGSGDNVTIAAPYGETGDPISIAYTVANLGTASNTLTYSGAASSPIAISGAGSGTSSYTVSSADAAADGVITLIAAFAHNSHPVAVAVVPTQTVPGAGTVTFTAGDLATDPNGGSITITAIVTEPDTSIATATLTSGTITLTGVAPGSTSIVVTITDGAGGTLNVTVPITVSAEAAVGEYSLVFTSDGVNSKLTLNGADAAGNAALGGGAYTWNDSTQTLTLTGINFTTAAATALDLTQFPSGATVEFAGANSFASTFNGAEKTYGIRLANNAAFVGNGSVTATGGTSAAGPAGSYGVHNSAGSLVISDGAIVTAIGGATAHTSMGIYIVASNLIIEGNATVTGTAGAATSGSEGYSYGIYASSAISISGNAIVTGTGGASDSISTGIRTAGTVTVTGGTVTARSGTATDSRAYNKQPTVTGYTNHAWTISTNSDGSSPTTGNTGAAGYSWAGTHKYVKIEPYTPSGGGDPEPDPEPEPESVIITFDENGGDTYNETKTVTSPATAIDALPTAPTRTGYTFAGWNTQSDGGGTAFTAETAVNASAADFTVYAQWTPIAYTISWYKDGVKIDDTTVNYGETPIHSPPSKDATLEHTYTFQGWDDSDGASAALAQIPTVTGNASYYAVFTAVTNHYTVTYNANGGNASYNETASVAYNSAVGTLPIPPTRDGYAFDSWNTQSDGSGSAFTAESIVTGAIEVYAQWTPIAYTISWYKDGVKIDDTTVNYGETPIHTPPSKDATIEHTYTFQGWDDSDGASTALAQIPAVTGNASYYAVFTAVTNRYTVTYNANGGNASYNETASVAYNSAVGTLPASPTRDGYAFDSWNTQSDGSGSAFTAASIVTGAIEVYAQWILIPVIITTALPVATYNTAYAAQLEASGAATIAYTLQVGSSLPSGLNLSTAGLISGTPTSVGTGSYNFTVVATNSGGSDTQAYSLTVNRAPTTLVVTLGGWTYGETANSPSVGATNPGGGTVTYTYYADNGNAKGALIGTTKPTNAGSYWIEASVLATANHLAGVSAAVKFVIAKAPTTLVVTLGGWTYGETANTPNVGATNPGGGTVTYTYYADDNNAKGALIGTTKPTTAGSYWVEASVPATENHLAGVSAAVKFVIAKAQTTLVVTLSGWTYGETANSPSVGATNPGGGTVTYTYYADDGGVKGAEIVTTKPSAAGSYWVEASVPATANHLAGVSAAVKFVIAKAATNLVVTLSGWTYGEAANSPSIGATNPGGGTVTYTYYADDGGVKGAEIVTTKPTTAGSYWIEASVPATANHLADTSAAVKFVIAKAPTTLVVTLGGWTYGEAANSPSIGATNPGGGTVTYTYYADSNNTKGALIGTTKPINAGSYWIEASVPATANHLADVSAAVMFVIAKAPTMLVVTLSGWTYGETANTPNVGATNPGGGTVTYTYYADSNNAKGTLIGTTKPTTAGSYWVEASVPATANHLAGVSAAVRFVIAKAPTNLVVTLIGWTYGEAANSPSIGATNPGGGTVTYIYYADSNNAKGAEIGTTKPNAAGS
jgi:uncharacterized repeat protein (TIGR02543 family)